VITTAMTGEGGMLSDEEVALYAYMLSDGPYSPHVKMWPW